MAKKYITPKEAAKGSLFGALDARAIRRLCMLKRIKNKNVGTKLRPRYMIEEGAAISA